MALAALGCDTDASGGAFPSADLVRFDGAALGEGTYDPRDGQVVIQQTTDADHDWSLAVHEGRVLVGVPALGELRAYALDGTDPVDGELVASGAASARFGESVSARGSRWVVGAPDTNAGPDAAQAGEVRVGSSPVATLTGSRAQGRLGRAVAACGDLDGDGIADLAAAAPWEASLSGRVYVTAAEASGTLSPAAAVESTDVDAQFGAALACGDDLFGEATADLAVGAPFGGKPADADTAVAWVTEGFVALFDADALSTGVAAQTLVVGTGEPDAFGAAVATCHLRESAYADLVVGAPLARDGDGVVYVYSGAAGVGTNPNPSISLRGTAGNGRFGAALACGDLDGDGLDELFVGAPGVDDPGGLDEVGALYVFDGLGTTAGTLTAADAHRVFTADRAYLRTGARFTVGDLDGDALVELVLVVRQKARSDE